MDDDSTQTQNGLPNTMVRDWNSEVHEVEAKTFVDQV